MFVLAHPFFSLHYIAPHVRVHFRAGASVMDKPDSQTPDTPDVANAKEDEPDRSWTDDYEDQLRDAETTLVEQEVVSAAERHSDSILLGGRDREEDRFVRVLLRNSYHDIVVPGRDGETQHVVFEPRLFLHESGAVQLTIRVATEGPLFTDQIVALMWGSDARIIRSEMASPLLKGNRLHDMVSGWSDKRDAGQPLAILDFEEPLSIIDMLGMHLQAVGHIIGSRLPNEWLTYPTAILEASNCCTADDWKTNHAGDIVRICARIGPGVELSEPVSLQKDFSRSRDHSLYVNSATSVYFQWRGSRPSGIPELATLLVVEYALYLFRRLEMLEREVAIFNLGDRKLRSLYRRSVLVLGELRQGNVRAGDARDIAGSLLNELGAVEVRSTVETALDLSGMAHSTISASSASRRAWWLTLLGTAVTIVIAYPQLEAGLAAFSSAKMSGMKAWLLQPAQVLASLGPWGAAIALLAIVVGFRILLFVWRFGRSLARNLGPSGFASDHRIVIEDHSVDTDELPEAGTAGPGAR